MSLLNVVSYQVRLRIPVSQRSVSAGSSGLGDIGKWTQRWKLEGRVAQIGKPYASDGERGNGLGYFEQYGVFNVLRAGDVSRSGDLGNTPWNRWAIVGCPAGAFCLKTGG